MIEVGAPVRTKSSVRPERFANQSARVASVRDGEVGLELAGHLVWFLPAELVDRRDGTLRPASRPGEPT